MAPARPGSARLVSARRVTWAELFFDVVFVFVITQVTELLRLDHGPKGLLQALVVFVPVYWAWVGISVYADTHEVDAVVDRLGLLVVGMASMFMALAMPGAYRDRGVLLGSSYFAARIILALLALRGPFRNVPRNPYNVALLISGPLMFAGGFVHGPARIAFWFTAGAVDLLAPRLLRKELARIPFDAVHLPERYGLFFIIALGESVILVGAVAADRPLTPLRLTAVASAYGLAFSLWWIYFHLAARAIQQAMERATIRTEIMRPVLTYAHLCLIGSVVAIAVGLAEVVVEPRHRLHADAAGLLAGGTALYLATFSYTRWRMCRRTSWERLGGVAACLVLVSVGILVPAVVAVLLLIAVVVAVNVSEARRVRQTGPDIDRSSRRPPERAHVVTVINPAQCGALSQANPSGSVKVPASLVIASRCDPAPSGETPASLARARRP
jgi:low temperature requirement protein LtrA